MRFEKQTTIAAPREKVFAYVTDFARHPEWADRDLKMQVSPGAVMVGTTFSHEAHQLGKQNDAGVVTELVPGRRIVFETTGKAGTVRHWFALDDASGGTTASKGMEFVKPSVSVRIASPGIRLNAPRALAKDLAHIKARLEGGS